MDFDSEQQIQVQCPYCFEITELVVEIDVQGRFVQDCDVCCRPWQVDVRVDRDGHREVRVERG